MRITHELSCAVDRRRKTIEVRESVTHECADAASDALEQHYRTVIETKDRLVRQGLIELGWLPPASTMLHSRREKELLGGGGGAD